MLEAASVAGKEFSPAAVACALRLDLVQIEEHCERLVRIDYSLSSAGISHWPNGTVASGYRFIHTLYHDVFYQRVTAARRSQLHRRVGECKESAYRPGAIEIAAELAIHFEQGRDYRRAIQYLRLATEDALGRYDYHGAIGYITRLLKLVDQLISAEQLSLRVEMLEQLSSTLSVFEADGGVTRKHRVAP
jgi:predicted ATPase